MMKYLGAKEIAKVWGISNRRVLQYCLDNRIEGAYQVGNTWAIPEDAIKPTDPRKEKNRLKRKEKINKMQSED